MTQTLKTVVRKASSKRVLESLSLHNNPLNTMTFKKCWFFNEAI